MPEQPKKINLHIKSKPKIIRSDFENIYDQAFHQVSKRQSEIINKEADEQQKNRAIKRMSVLDVLNRKITISQYEKYKNSPNPPLQAIEKMRERRRSLTSHRMSANTIHNKMSKDSQLEENKKMPEQCESDSHFQSAFTKQTNKEREFIKNNIERFFTKQDPKAYTLSNGKTRVKMVMRDSKSMKTLDSKRNEKISGQSRVHNGEETTIKSNQSLLMSYSTKNKLNEEGNRFKSLSSLSHHPKINAAETKQLRGKNESPLPLINQTNLAEKPEHVDNHELMEIIKNKQKIDLNSMFSSAHSDYSAKEHLMIEKHKFSQSKPSPGKVKTKPKLFKVRKGSTNFDVNYDDAAIQGWNEQNQKRNNEKRRIEKGLFFEEEEQQSEVLFHSSIHGF